MITELLTQLANELIRAPGVDDNGSGSAAVMEVAKRLAPFRGRLPYTIMFVLFDLEEEGLRGSVAFTSDYLVPKLLETKSRIQGAFIIDMALLYEDASNTQVLPTDVAPVCAR